MKAHTIHDRVSQGVSRLRGRSSSAHETGVTCRSLVSVVIPVYNRLEYICHALDSVLAQTYKDYEIVVVDDGSRPSIKHVIEPYLGRIKYLYQENRGLAAARNTGIRSSSGEYLAFLDDDDLFEPRKLETQVPILDRNPEVGLVYSDCYEFDGGVASEPRLVPAVGRDAPWSEFARLFFVKPYVYVPTILIRRQCLEEVGLFDTTLTNHHDGDMWLRIALRWEARFSDYPSGRWRRHGRNMSQDRIGMNKSIITSSKKILTLHPQFRESLGTVADEVLAERYFLLGKACLHRSMPVEAVRHFVSSRWLTRKYVNLAWMSRGLLRRLRGKALSFPK